MRNLAKRFTLGAVVFLAIALGQEVKEADEYTAFEFEKKDKNFHLIFESTVNKLKNVEEYPIFWEEIRGHYKYISDVDFLKYSKNGDFFKYTYVFRNLEKSKLKINFAAQDMVDSPLVDIFQDFSLSIEPNDASVEISFIAPGAPEKIDSPLNIKFWREGAVSDGRWTLYRAGSCRIYKPSTRLYIREDLEVVIRKEQ